MMSASKGHRCFFPQILSFLEIIHYEPGKYKLAKVSLGHHGVMSALTLSALCEGYMVSLKLCGLQLHISWMVPFICIPKPVVII